MKLIFLIFVCFTVFVVTTNEWQQNINSYDSFNGESNDNAFVKSHIGLESVLEGTSAITVFNPTFKWKIKNLHLFDFRTHPTFDGPRLFAIDRSNDGKIYDIHVSLAADVSDEDANLEIIYYNIECQFNIPPVKTEYLYIINETTFNGSIIEKSNLNDSIENILIVAKPFFHVTKEFMESSVPILLGYENNPTSLRSDLIEVFKKDHVSKFVIECGGEEITAYKPIMHARSEMFNKLLSNGTDRILITDFQPKIVKKVVEFCNNEFIESFVSDEKIIFSMANAYRIPSLMAYSSKEITENVSNENILELYKFADFYNYEPLKKWLLVYIIKNLSEISVFKHLDASLYKPILEELLKEKKII